MMLMSHKDLLSRHFAVDMPPTDQTWGQPRDVCARRRPKQDRFCSSDNSLKPRSRLMWLGPPVQLPLKARRLNRNRWVT